MISTNSRDPDQNDTAVLFYAMCKFGEENDDIEMSASGYGELLSRAEQAAEVIAEWHKDEGDDWEGVLWCERLEATDDDSLAAALWLLDSDRLDAVTHITMQWLKDL